MTVQLRRLALGLLVIVASVGVEFTAASAAVPANASCLGYGSSVTGPLHLRAGIATNPESSPPGADTSDHAHEHGNTFDTCFAE